MLVEWSSHGLMATLIGTEPSQTWNLTAYGGTLSEYPFYTLERCALNRDDQQDQAYQR